MLRVHKIIEKTQVEGPGTRFCIWLQGCPHRCKGCFNPETWDFNGGFKVSPKELLKNILNTKGIEGITLLGGEPFEQAEELLYIARNAKENGLSVLAFSGYTYAQLTAKNDYCVNELLKYTDLLLDGRYVEELTDYSRPWVGSLNQNFIFLSDRYCVDDLKKYKNGIEIRIDKNGSVVLNGMGDYQKVKKIFNKKGVL